MEGIGIGLGIVALALAYLAIWAVVGALAARDKHIIVCPADGQPASVRCRAIDGARLVLGGDQLRVAACDNWPERKGCTQGCVEQLRAAPTLELVPPSRRPPRS